MEKPIPEFSKNSKQKDKLRYWRRSRNNSSNSTRMKKKELLLINIVDKNMQMVIYSDLQQFYDAGCELLL